MINPFKRNGNRYVSTYTALHVESRPRATSDEKKRQFRPQGVVIATSSTGLRRSTVHGIRSCVSEGVVENHLS